MEHPDTPEQYAEGARLARNNASTWLDDAEYLAKRSADSHSLAAAIMGCEESAKAYVWLACSWMDHNEAVAFEEAIRKGPDRHYAQMFLAIWLGSLSQYLLSPSKGLHNMPDDFLSDPLQNSFHFIGDFLRGLPVDLSALFYAIPHLPGIRAMAFYVDWTQSDNSFRTPRAVSPQETFKYIDAGRELIKLLDYALPLWDQVSPEQREQLGLAWTPVVRMLISKDKNALEPILATLGAGVTGSPLLPGTPSSPP